MCYVQKAYLYADGNAYIQQKQTGGLGDHVTSILMELVELP
jgi:hypothetical protein